MYLPLLEDPIWIRYDICFQGLLDWNVEFLDVVVEDLGHHVLKFGKKLVKLKRMKTGLQ